MNGKLPERANETKRNETTKRYGMVEIYFINIIFNLSFTNGTGTGTGPGQRSDADDEDKKESKYHINFI